MEPKLNELAPEGRHCLKLESCSTDVLGRILNLTGMTRPVIRLWTSGAPIMRHKIRQVVTEMRFESHGEHDFDALPLILVDLPSLRSLSVSRGSNTINCVHKYTSVLKSLTPSLEKLVLGYPGSFDIFEPNPGLHIFKVEASGDQSDLTSKDFYIDLIQHFPKLQWLELETEDSPCYSPHLLPSSLTHLKADIKFLTEVHHMPNLPYLTHLETPSTSDMPESFWATLPQCLEHLDLSQSYLDFFAPEIFKTLPRTLKTLVLPPNPLIEFPLSSIQDLPRNLESLLYINLHEFNELDLLPPRLLTLQCGAEGLVATQLRQLPRSLTSLGVHLNYTDCLANDDFPPNLTHLRLKSKYKGHYGTIGINELMPYKHLRSLDIIACSFSETDFNHLPDALTHLSITEIVNPSKPVTISLPPRLESLTLCLSPGSSCEGPSRFIFGKIPESVKHVTLSLNMNASDLFKLPARLESLHLSTGLHVDSFNPDDPETIERIEYLRKVAQETKTIFDTKYPALATDRPYCLFDLLPRTLSRLEFSKMALHMIEPSAWQAIPTNLKSFSSRFTHTHLPPTALDCLPFESITDFLRLEYGTFTDEHVKRLNRLLRKFEAPNATWHLTPACVPYMPQCMQFDSLWPADVKAAHQSLTELRRACLDSEDRQGFRALGMP